MAQRRHIRNILAAVVALLAQSVTAVDWNQWSLAKTYDSTNFFEEFAFWVVSY